MKRSAMAVAVACVISTPAFATTDGLYHKLGIATVNDVQDVKAHADRNTSLAEANQRNLQEQSAWNGRQEGVIRQNRGRLDDMDERNQRQDDSIDNAHARIEGVEEESQQRDNELSTRIDQTESVNKDQSQGIKENAQGISNNTQYIGSVEQVNRQQQASLNHLSTYTQDNRARIEDLEGHTKDLDAGVASAIAAASHHFYLGSNAGGQISLAGGTYEGESATSLAIGAPLNDKVFTNVNWSHDSRGNDAFGGGVTIQLW